ncbi:MAG TPA: hypothetical protein ENF44_06615 [Deltaproteobacteria bacterium]|nr:hypothetical protein [Deltaproteobacteria bacterium]
MRKATFILCLFLFFPSPLPSFEGMVQRVVDGDTVVLVGGEVIRYLGVNCPERGEPFWREATELNRRLVAGRKVRLELEEEIRRDRYGRMLAYVYCDGLFVNGELLRRGMAHLFCLQPLKLYQDLFSLQESARERGIGIWGRGGFRGPLKITSLLANAPGDDRLNLNGEYLRVCNISSRPVKLKGFSIEDRQGHHYTFPGGVLKPGFTAVLHSGQGRDVMEGFQLVFYWRSPHPIWNNKGDTAYLFDPQGRLIHRFEYRR